MNLPQSPESEAALLGAIIFDAPNTRDKILELGVTADSFYDVRNQKLFEHFAEMDANRIDSVTIIDALKRTGSLDKVGGFDRLTYLHNSHGINGYIESYAKTVTEAHRARLHIEACEDSIKEVVGGSDADIAISKAISRMEEIVPVSTTTHAEDVEFAKSELMKIANGEMVGIPFPYKLFQRSTFGLPLGAVTPMLGRDKTGKSRLVCTWVLDWGLNGIPTIVFAFEDGRARYIHNLAASLGEYDGFTIRRNPSPIYIDNAIKCADRLKSLPIRVVDDSHTVETALIEVAKFSREHSRNPIAVVFDGWKDFVESGGKENRTQSENHMFETLKRGAIKLNAGILCIEHPHDVEDNKWLSKRNIKGSKQRFQSARMALAYQDSGFPDSIKEKFGIYDEDDYVVLDCQACSYGTRSYVVLRPNLEQGRFDEVISVT